jgi:UDP-galactopyranose mutase
MLPVFEKINIQVHKKGTIIFQKDAEHSFAYVVLFGQVNLYDIEVQKSEKK